MIDFNNAVFAKLKAVHYQTYSAMLAPMLLPSEEIIATFQGIRDGVVFTDHRIIAINVQGITGKKKDFTTIPYSKIQAYSVETAGIGDMDSELELWISGLGKVKFEFSKDTNVLHICRIISEKVL